MESLTFGACSALEKRKGSKKSFGGSNPSGSSSGDWIKIAYGRFPSRNNYRDTMRLYDSNWLERRTLNPKVEGSNPSGRTLGGRNENLE